MKLIFFGRCAEWMGCREMRLDQPSPAVLCELLRNVPELAPICEHQETMLVSVNGGLAELDTAVDDGDEVAFLPPFTV